MLADMRKWPCRTSRDHISILPVDHGGQLANDEPVLICSLPNSIGPPVDDMVSMSVDG